MAKDSEKIINKLTEELFKKIGLKASIEVKSEEEGFKVNVDGENLGALIGYHGETLESLQLLLSLMANNQIGDGDWKRVILDIGAWREERLNTLESMVERSVAELQGQGLTRLALPPMSPNQRREVHVIVTSKYPNLITESEGDEPNRRVVLYSKPNN